MYSNQKRKPRYSPAGTKSNKLNICDLQNPEEMQKDKFISNDKMRFSFFISLLVHTFILVAVGISYKITHLNNSSIEVTLVRNNDDEFNKNADFKSMNNQQGSGNQEKIMLQKARTNVPIRGRHINDVLQKMKKKTDKDRQNRNPKNDKSKTNMVQKVIVTNYNLEKDVVDLIQQNNSFSFGVINPFANNKDYNSEVIDSLEARIAKEKEDLAKKQKIVTITSAVSTKKDYLASYMYKWVSRVEKIGNSYYPQFVRQFGLEGRLIMMVTVNTDGSVDYVKILKSSNSRILDDAAIQIVRMATPFDPMSKEMSQKVYKLQIIRTWVFNKNTLNTTSAKKQPDEKKKERAKF